MSKLEHNFFYAILPVWSDTIVEEEGVRPNHCILKRSATMFYVEIFYHSRSVHAFSVRKYSYLHLEAKNLYRPITLESSITLYYTMIKLYLCINHVHAMVRI